MGVKVSLRAESEPQYMSREQRGGQMSHMILLVSYNPGLKTDVA